MYTDEVTGRPPLTDSARSLPPIGAAPIWLLIPVPGASGSVREGAKGGMAHISVTYVRFSYSGDRNRYIRLIGGGGVGGDSNERFVVRPSELWRGRQRTIGERKGKDMDIGGGWAEEL